MRNYLLKKYNYLEIVKAEQAEQQEQALESQRQQEAQYEQLVDSMVSVARNTEDFHNLILEDEDREEVLSYLLDRDVNGRTAFSKLLDNPEAVFQLAWYALKGDESFNTVHDYYKKVIDSTRKQSKPASQPSKVVTKKSGGYEKETDPYGIWS